MRLWPQIGQFLKQTSSFSLFIYYLYHKIKFDPLFAKTGLWTKYAIRKVDTTSDGEKSVFFVTLNILLWLGYLNELMFSLDENWLYYFF